jgi:hypothetical protein
MSEMRGSGGMSREELEQRLRALPEPPVPEGLEARLLAAIPADVVCVPRWRRPALLWGAAAALAACLVIALLSWPRRPDPGPPAFAHIEPRPAIDQPRTNQEAPVERPSGMSAGAVEVAARPFVWPVDGTMTLFEGRRAVNDSQW